MHIKPSVVVHTVVPAQERLRMRQEDWECEPSVRDMKPYLRKQK